MTDYRRRNQGPRFQDLDDSTDQPGDARSPDRRPVAPKARLDDDRPSDRSRNYSPRPKTSRKPPTRQSAGDGQSDDEPQAPQRRRNNARVQDRGEDISSDEAPNRARYGDKGARRQPHGRYMGSDDESYRPQRNGNAARGPDRMEESSRRNLNGAQRRSRRRGDGPDTPDSSDDEAKQDRREDPRRPRGAIPPRKPYQNEDLWDDDEPPAPRQRAGIPRSRSMGDPVKRQEKTDALRRPNGSRRDQDRQDELRNNTDDERRAPVQRRDREQRPRGDGYSSRRGDFRPRAEDPRLDRDDDRSDRDDYRPRRKEYRPDRDGYRSDRDNYRPRDRRDQYPSSRGESDRQRRRDPADRRREDDSKKKKTIVDHYRSVPKPIRDAAQKQAIGLIRGFLDKN